MTENQHQIAPTEDETAGAYATRMQRIGADPVEIVSYWWHKADTAERNARRWAEGYDNLAAERDAIQTTLREWRETDHGQAVQRAERAEREAERAEQRAREAEAKAEQALASVAGGEDIDPRDPRVAHIWRKASRIAKGAGFCSEYERIADALGIPPVKHQVSGTVSVKVEGWVEVPVSGEMERGDMDDVDNILELVDINALADAISEATTDGSVDWWVTQHDLTIEGDDD